MENFLFEKCILRYFKHEPTTDQKSGINKLSRFIFYNKKKAGLVIKGYAGTGKTTLISSLVGACKEKGRKIVLLAPTGRAAKVISSYSGSQASTIHRYIYKVKHKSDGYFFSLAKNKSTNTLFVVDEASMVPSLQPVQSNANQSSGLLSDLLQFVYSGKDCKVIFVGDHAQLPPVGWSSSPALNLSYLNQLSEVDFYHFELKQVVRQSEHSAILKQATTLRQNIDENNNSLNIKTNNSDLRELRSFDIQDSFQSAFSELNLGNAIVVCRSNKRANIYNKEIRFNVLYFDDALCPGDLIMAVKNNYYWLESFSDEGFIANGDILKVSRVYNFEEKYDYSFADIDFYFSDQPSQKMYSCKVNLTTLMLDGPNIPTIEMKKLFLEIEKDNLYIENKKDRKSDVMNSPYFQALQIKFAYALTCHKAQGGQWPTVFLDQGYLPENSINRELLRWMYTSFTRAIDQLYLLNFNPLFTRNEEI